MSGLTADRIAALLYWCDHPNSLWQPQSQETQAPYLRRAHFLLAPWGDESEGIVKAARDEALAPVLALADEYAAYPVGATAYPPQVAANLRAVAEQVKAT